MKSGNSEPRVLLIDIENTPYSVYTWDNNPRTPISHENIIKEAEMLCAAWMWLGEDKVYSIQAPPGGGDFQVARKLQEVISEADAVVAHFGDGHDIPWIMTRCLVHNLGPLKPVVQIDTWKLCKRRFKLYNNKLAYLAQKLGLVHGKLDTDFQLWKDCMAGDKVARAHMLLYNEQDVRVLEQVYQKIRAFDWVPRINRALFVENPDLRAQTCPHCGALGLIWDSFRDFRTVRRNQYKCVKCKAYSVKINDLPR